MSAAAATLTPTTQLSRVGRLLDLVRRLIDYGKELAATLRQPDAATDLPAAARPFGTADIALILARITRGLHRADALEARLLRNAARLDAPPRPRTASRAAQPAAAARSRPAPPADPRLDHLPTPEQIAAEVRCRSIGAVIADICRDLGIMPDHPLWRELSALIIRHGGSLAGLLKDILQRAFPCPAPATALAGCPAGSLARSPTSTGPP